MFWKQLFIKRHNFKKFTALNCLGNHYVSYAETDYDNVYYSDTKWVMFKIVPKSKIAHATLQNI